LNARSYEYQSLKQEAEADKKLYEELVRKIKEAGINAGFQNSAIRIADMARPAVKPVFPNTLLNIVLAAFFALLLSIGGAFISDALNNTVRDPEQIARMNTEVVASLPAIKEWRGRAQALMPGNSNVAVLPASSSGQGTTFSSYEEAIRTLRNSIFLSDFDRRVRTMMVGSPSPSEGKTTVASHLAIAHAQQGRRTLILDADLRRPSLHRRFDLAAPVGLVDVLTSGLDWREARVNHSSVPNLDVLPAGPASRRAADLLGIRLSTILNEALEEYDLVILDSPPLLGFPEPLELACLVDGVLLVALAGSTNRKALRTAVSTLNRLRVNLIGVALNEVKADSSSGYYYHYYSAKYYRHYEANASNF
jgi:capsular exopolysaccharide synthesis family protein